MLSVKNNYTCKYAEFYDNGNKAIEVHYKKGKLHNDEGPAEMFYSIDGKLDNEKWYQNGKLNSFEDKPSCIIYDCLGNKMIEKWYKNGKLHREIGPARIDYFSTGEIQSVEYYLEDKLHRESQPAMTFYDKTGKRIRCIWCLEGNYLYEELY